MNTGIVEAERQDYRVITGWVTEGASVLELGCGGGELLQTGIVARLGNEF